MARCAPQWCFWKMETPAWLPKEKNSRRFQIAIFFSAEPLQLNGLQTRSILEHEDRTSYAGLPPFATGGCGRLPRSGFFPGSPCGHPIFRTTDKYTIGTFHDQIGILQLSSFLGEQGFKIAINSSGEAPLCIKIAPASLAAIASFASTLNIMIFKSGYAF